ncbi:MAG: acyl-CoA dehydrogenase family protein [Pseudomonadaceae bacterium]|nr:acyl-CoA dehydrogenase family protein [Pseudomonadaceae bacterium]
MAPSPHSDEEHFREEVRAFLAENLDDELRRAARLTTGVHSHIDASQRWYKILADKGWIAPTWPKEFGGTGWSASQCHLFNLECTRAGAPLLCQIGIRHLGPVLMAHGTQAQKDCYLPAILSGEHIWCQGYSEPPAGSDLAALKLKAERGGDEYVLNGTKLWTTGAHFSTHMFCLARSATGARKQEGITYLLIDMTTPGITIEPIISISGEHELNQVFFDNVRVPVANRVGPEGEGWRVAKDQMQFARSNNINTAWVRETLTRLSRFCATESTGYGDILADDPAFARRLAQADILLQSIEMMELRVLAANEAGHNPGALSSMLKTRGSEVKQRVSELAADAVAYYGLPLQHTALNPFAPCSIIGSEVAATALPTYLNERAATIYSGASEIQRDVLAKRVLGL